MGFQEDVVDDITAQISHIGLSTDGSTEYAGTGYSAIAPTYAAAASGAADITNGPLEFDGDSNDGPVTHLLFKKDAGATDWVFRPVDVQESFNSDGRLDVTSAEVTSAFPA